MIRTIALAFVAITLISCQSSTEPVSPKVALAYQIDSLETVLKSAGGELNEQLAGQMVEKYDAYIKDYPEDSLSAFYAYRAGDISMNRSGKELYAVDYYMTVHDDHEEHPLAPQALFMVGMAFDQLGDKDRAVRSFQYFTRTYPDHEWVEQANEMIVLNTDTADLEDQVKGWLERSKQEN